MYYTGVFLGLLVWMFFLYWVKSNRNPDIAFDKKYLVPFFISVVVAAFQLALELLNNPPVIAFAEPLMAFIAGFTMFVAIQEIIKGILNTEQVNYFDK